MNEQQLSTATMKAAGDNAKFKAHPRYTEYLCAVHHARAAGANHTCDSDNPYNIIVRKIAAEIKESLRSA